MNAASPELDQQLQALAEQLTRVLGSLGLDGERAETPDSRDASAFGFSSPRDEGSARLIRATRIPLPDPLLVRRIIRQRQLRARYFDGDLFADPAWDILLDLTAARAEHNRVSVTSLCIASGVPPTTALRWIGLMTEAGMLKRIEDDSDRRRAFITLTDKTADAIARYFRDLGRHATGLV